MKTRILPAVLVLSATVAAQVSWKQRTPGRTQSLASLTFAHDTKRDVYLSFAFDYSTRKKELWQLRGTSWSKLSPKTMPVFDVGETVYDSHRDRVVLVAIKYNGPSETWEWDGADWKLRVGVPTPLGSGFELVFDDNRGVVTAVTAIGNKVGVLDYDGVSWKQRTVTNAPIARSHFSCAVGDGSLLLFGGLSGSIYLAQTWVLAGNRWIQVPGPVPPNRIGAGMCYDPTRQRFVLMGGRTVGDKTITTLSDTWEWHGKWTERERTNPVIARESHFMLWDPIRERSLAFSGAFTSGGGDVIKSFSLDSSFDYGPDRPAHVTDFGRGCASAQTAPRIEALTRPWIGESLQLSVTGVTTSTPLLLFTGSSRTRWGSLKLPLDLTIAGMPGCFLNTSAELVMPVQAPVQYSLPNDRGLVGLRYFHQIAAIDAAANAVGLVLSAGVELQLGEG